MAIDIETHLDWYFQRYIDKSEDLYVNSTPERAREGLD